MRIHIAYSDRHYNPFVTNKETYWYSCSQIAMHVWNVLKNSGHIVTYGDEVPSKDDFDILFTNRHFKRPKNVKKQIYFASVAHLQFVNSSIRGIKNNKSGKEGDGYYSRKAIYKYMRTLMDSDFVVAIGNKTILSSFLDRPFIQNNSIEVINCGVDSKQFQYKDNEFVSDPIFLHVATRFSYRKGSDLLPQAWQKVQKKHPNVKLLLLGRLGDVDLPDSFLGHHSVEMLGKFQSGSDQYIRNLSKGRWVVLPSVAEGQAGTLLEAMSCGCVPIATLESGIDANRYYGFTTLKGNSESLAENMIKAVDEWNPDLGRKVHDKITTVHSWIEFENNILTICERVSGLPRKPRKVSQLFWRLSLRMVDFF